MTKCTKTPNCDADPVTFWFSSPSVQGRGQGKRVGGMIKGGMGARVEFATKMNTTIAEMKKNAIRITQTYVNIRYFDVFMCLHRVEELPLFFEAPREFTVIHVLKRLGV